MCGALTQACMCACVDRTCGWRTMPWRVNWSGCGQLKTRCRGQGGRQGRFGGRGGGTGGSEGGGRGGRTRLGGKVGFLSSTCACLSTCLPSAHHMTACLPTTCRTVGRGERRSSAWSWSCVVNRRNWCALGLTADHDGGSCTATRLSGEGGGAADHE